jgi:hypothetical protein
MGVKALKALSDPRQRPLQAHRQTPAGCLLACIMALVTYGRRGGCVQRGARAGQENALCGDTLVGSCMSRNGSAASVSQRRSMPAVTAALSPPSPASPLPPPRVYPIFLKGSAAAGVGNALALAPSMRLLPKRKRPADDAAGSAAKPPRLVQAVLVREL